MNTDKNQVHDLPKLGIVGDSRAVGQMWHNGFKTGQNPIIGTGSDGNKVYAKVGEGQRWFMQNLGNIKNNFDDCDAILINLGANDVRYYGGANIDKMCAAYANKNRELTKNECKD